MKKRIIGYRTRIDVLLDANLPDTQWEDVLEEHLVQLGFFQHERLVHLLVTLAFAMMGLAVVIITCFWTTIWMMLLSFFLMLLLVPYIMHYYLLENETQKMYAQYDRILENIRKNESK